MLSVQLFRFGDQGAVRADDAQGDLHVGQGEIDLFGAFRGVGEVRQHQVHLEGLQVFNAVRGIQGHDVELHAQVGGQPAGQVDVISLVFAVLVHIAEGLLVGEEADGDLSALLDFIQGAEAFRGSSSSGQQQDQGQGQGKYFVQQFHIGLPSFRLSVYFFFISPSGLFPVHTQAPEHRSLAVRV